MAIIQAAYRSGSLERVQRVLDPPAGRRRESARTARARARWLKHGGTSAHLNGRW